LEVAVFRFAYVIIVVLIGFTYCAPASAATVTFFDPSQIATLVTEGTTWDKVRSNGYYFTYTRDKLFTGGGTEPIGRYVRIPWPDGVEAQAVTAGPSPGKAKITIERVDGDVFDLNAFTAKLLANTAGAGADFEVVPFLNGEEVLQDPVIFNATGFYGQSFSYNTTPNPWGQSTAPLTGYDKYTIDLYVDFAWTALTLIGAPIPSPPGDYNADGIVGAADYVVWRKTPNDYGGDPDGYTTWRSNFGQTAGSGAGTGVNRTVPEPAALALLMFAAVGWCLRRGRPAYEETLSNRRPMRLTAFHAVRDGNESQET
jgi:hypothetical protein